MPVELDDGVKIEDGLVFVPDGHRRWPGLRGNQSFVPLWDELGMLVKLDSLDSDQVAALLPAGLPEILP